MFSWPAPRRLLEPGPLRIGLPKIAEPAIGQARELELGTLLGEARFRASELRSHLRYDDTRDYSAAFDPVADVHVHRREVSGNAGVEQCLLPSLGCPREREHADVLGRFRVGDHHAEGRRR